MKRSKKRIATVMALQLPYQVLIIFKVFEMFMIRYRSKPKKNGNTIDRKARKSSIKCQQCACISFQNQKHPSSVNQPTSSSIAHQSIIPHRNHPLPLRAVADSGESVSIVKKTSLYNSRTSRNMKFFPDCILRCLTCWYMRHINHYGIRFGN